MLKYLAIYAKLHEQVKDEIYVAIPKNGNPNKMWIWRYDPEKVQLNKISSGGDDFPIHFVATFGIGMLYNGATLNFDPIPDDPSEAQSFDLSRSLTTDISPAIVPITLDMRAHYTNFMVNWGLEFGYNMNGDGWKEYIQTPGHDENSSVEAVTLNCADPQDLSTCTVESIAYHEESFNRALYFGLGYVFGRDASIGIGPRLALRSSWLNMPHSWSPTAHFGWTVALPQPENLPNRVRFVADVDLRAGMNISTYRSLYFESAKEDDEDNGLYAPTFGLVVGVGSTF
jgi:hypothetical protein